MQIQKQLKQATFSRTKGLIYLCFQSTMHEPIAEGACHSVLQMEHGRRANMLGRTTEMESLVIIVGRKRLVITINGVFMC